ncbi:hypothetical protein SVIOM342S_00045 [Streptomyces violaceorubidus]
MQHGVNQVLTVLLIFVATLTAARVIAGLVRTVTTSRSGVAGSATIFVNITRILVLARLPARRGVSTAISPPWA